jgi:aquaporin Z
MGGETLSQLWLFWVAPNAGAVLAGLAYLWLDENHQAAT